MFTNTKKGNWLLVSCEGCCICFYCLEYNKIHRLEHVGSVCYCLPGSVVIAICDITKMQLLTHNANGWDEKI